MSQSVSTAPEDIKDERPTQVEADREATLSEIEQTYAGMAEQTDAFYKAQIDAAKDYADKQSAIQQQQTDFAIEQIEQQKAQAQKDYTKEQSGAYVDWRKQSGEYGAEAEKMAASGLKGTGYSETSQVAYYNTYQNRVAVARESFNKAILNYNNMITQARLQNSAALAEIAYNALQAELELTLENMQYQNQLLIDEANSKLEIKDMYHGQYMDVYNQILAEKEFEEGVRQFNEELALAQSKLDAAASGGATSVTGTTSGDDDTGEDVDPLYIKPRDTTGTNSIKTYEVDTPYYKGNLNPDASAFGTFANGYQPKGISGHGKLSKTGDEAHLSTRTLDGQSQTVVQNVWQAEDGTLWYWEGRQNKYIMLGQDNSKTGGSATAGALVSTSMTTRN